MPESRIVERAKRAKRLAGCGSAFPARSTPLRNFENHFEDRVRRDIKFPFITSIAIEIYFFKLFFAALPLNSKIRCEKIAFLRQFYMVSDPYCR